MNNSKSDSHSNGKQNAGFASASAPSTQDANKVNGVDPKRQDPNSTVIKDKDLSQQETQSHKADGASSDQTGKDAAADEGSQVSDGIASAPAGKQGEASPGLSAQLKA